MFVFSVHLHALRTAFAHETLSLECGEDRKTVSTTVDWYYKQVSDRDASFAVITNSRVNRDAHFGDRSNISGSTLIIYDVKLNDSGLFRCTELTSAKDEHYVYLTVTGNFIKRNVSSVNMVSKNWSEF